MLYIMLKNFLKGRICKSYLPFLASYPRTEASLKRDFAWNNYKKLGGRWRPHKICTNFKKEFLKQHVRKHVHNYLLKEVIYSNIYSIYKNKYMCLIRQKGYICDSLVMLAWGPKSFLLNINDKVLLFVQEDNTSAILTS